MKFFSWVQNKIDGRRGKEKPSSVSENRHDQLKQQPVKEYWSNRLLSIGTFGNHDPISSDPRVHDQPDGPSSSLDLSELTTEQVGQLQKELTKLLKRKLAAKQEDDPNPDSLPLDRFLSCPSTLDISYRIASAVCSGQDLSEDNMENKKYKEAIGMKSLSFLRKKVRVFAGGFSFAPSLRDPLLESRMEKLLRETVQEIYQQKLSRSSTPGGCIVGSKQRKKDKDHEVSKEKPRSTNGSRWVVTDAEYIILEI